MENQKYIMNTYKRYDLCLTEGNGCYVKDSTGKEYLDFVCGIAVMSLGHGNKKVVDTIKLQADHLMQCSNLFYTKPQMDFAKLLVENSIAKKVFFCNSGAEANEAAIKLARKYGYMKSILEHDSENGLKSNSENSFEYNSASNKLTRVPQFVSEKEPSKKYKILTMKNSFHGRTMATVTATGQEKYHTGFYPLLSGFEYVDFNDCKALTEAFSDEVCGLLIEPVQGEGGLIEATEEFLSTAKALCQEYDALLIFDEVQCGLGRTGKVFAYENYGVTPDVVTLSKALGGGVPMGACLAGEKAADIFSPGDHASTFGGNPLAAAAGLAAFQVLLEDNLAENAEKMGKSFYSKLSQLKEKHKEIIEIRGKGLMLGLVLTDSATPYIEECHKNGLLVCSAGPNIIRFLPPLIATEKELEKAMNILNKVFTTI